MTSTTLNRWYANKGPVYGYYDFEDAYVRIDEKGQCFVGFKGSGKESPREDSNNLLNQVFLNGKEITAAEYRKGVFGQ